jgi:hypothetical protein
MVTLNTLRPAWVRSHASVWDVVLDQDMEDCLAWP